MTLVFYGGVETVTGANFILGKDGRKIMVDCGMFQGFKFCEDSNEQKFPYDPASVDYLFVTHSHMDHIGRIPKLVKDGFKGEIYSTAETKLISEIMFEDAYKIMENEARLSGGEVLYDMSHVRRAMSLWKVLPYHSGLELFGGISVCAKDAGHVLGSAMWEFSLNGKKILFTGDLGNSPAPLLRDTEAPGEPKYLVMESVYGDRNHEPKEEREGKFKRVVLETIAKKGVLVIPAFSLERTQVILYELNNLVEKGEVPEIPVFLDSPMAIKITEVYEKFPADFNRAVRREISGGDDIFHFPKLKNVVRAQDSAMIAKAPSPKIIIAGSGMSNGGRVIGHELNYLPDPKTTLLFVGYQSAGTLGRELSDGAKKVKIMGKEIEVRAKIESIEGYSAHKDMDHLVDFVGQAGDSLEKVFVVMGEPKASAFLAQRLADNFSVDAICPEKNQVFDLEF